MVVKKVGIREARKCMHARHKQAAKKKSLGDDGCTEEVLLQSVFVAGVLLEVFHDVGCGEMVQEVDDLTLEFGGFRRGDLLAETVPAFLLMILSC